jgi:hypothetical protein
MAIVVFNGVLMLAAVQLGHSSFLATSHLVQNSNISWIHTDSQNMNDNMEDEKHSNNLLAHSSQETIAENDMGVYCIVKQERYDMLIKDTT